MPGSQSKQLPTDQFHMTEPMEQSPRRPLPSKEPPRSEELPGERFAKQGLPPTPHLQPEPPVPPQQQPPPGG